MNIYSHNNECVCVSRGILETILTSTLDAISTPPLPPEAISMSHGTLERMSVFTPWCNINATPSPGNNIGVQRWSNIDVPWNPWNNVCVHLWCNVNATPSPRSNINVQRWSNIDVLWNPWNNFNAPPLMQYQRTPLPPRNICSLKQYQYLMELLKQY